MPVDGNLKSRREVTGRALGTAGFVAGVFIDLDDMTTPAEPGKAGKLDRLLTPIADMPYEMDKTIELQ